MQVTEIDSIKVSYEKGSNNTMFVKLEGYLDTYNSHDFLIEIITKVLGKEYCKIIFNCEGLSFISSTGIGVFIEILKNVKERGGGIAFYNVPTKVYDVFHLLGFTQLFLIGKDKKEAIDKLEGKINTPACKETKCPICGKAIKVKPGRFRCSGCKGIIKVAEDLTVSID